MPAKISLQNITQASCLKIRWGKKILYSYFPFDLNPFARPFFTSSTAIAGVYLFRDFSWQGDGNERVGTCTWQVWVEAKSETTTLNSAQFWQVRWWIESHSTIPAILPLSWLGGISELFDVLVSWFNAAMDLMGASHHQTKVKLQIFVTIPSVSSQTPEKMKKNWRISPNKTINFFRVMIEIYLISARWFDLG